MCIMLVGHVLVAIRCLWLKVHSTWIFCFQHSNCQFGSIPRPLTLYDKVICCTLCYRGPEDVMSNRGNDLLLKLLQFRSVIWFFKHLFSLLDMLKCIWICWETHMWWCHFLPRYPKIMTDEGIRVVRQWLGSSSHLEEGKRAHLFTPASLNGQCNNFAMPGFCTDLWGLCQLSS